MLNEILHVNSTW